MAYGFNDDKSKVEVYDKDSINTLLSNLIKKETASATSTNQITLAAGERTLIHLPFSSAIDKNKIIGIRAIGTPLTGELAIRSVNVSATDNGFHLGLVAVKAVTFVPAGSCYIQFSYI